MSTSIVCLGDSITAAFPQSERDRWTVQLQQALDGAFPGRYEVYNRGVGGNTSRDVLLRFTSSVMPLLPGVVLIELGFNDASVIEPLHIPICVPAAFRAHLVEIVRLVRVGKGHPILIVNHPIKHNGKLQSNGKPYIENYAGYADIIRGVACDMETPIIDLEASMLADHVDLDVLLAEDGLHLTREGNRIYAQYVLCGLLPVLKNLPEVPLTEPRPAC